MAKEEDAKLADAKAAEAAGKEPDVGAGEGEGVTEDDLYEGLGEEEGGKKSDGAGKPAGGEVRPAGKGEAPPKGDGEDEDDPDGKGKKAWDADRQARDQERANERRLQEARMQKIEDGQLEILKLMAAGKKPGSGEGEAEDELAKRIEALSEDSEPADLIGALQAQHRLIVELKKGGKKETDPAVLARLAQVEAKTAGRDDEQALDEIIASLEKEFGPQHRAKAYAGARKYFADRGYDEDNPPGLAETELALRLEYERAARGVSLKPKPKGEKLAGDDGRGGGPAGGLPKRGNLKSMTRAMQKAGLLSP